MRLQKAMSQLGICSRRQAEELIDQGKVKVKQEVVTFLFNKPLGVVSSSKDDRGRRVVVDFFKNENYRLYPVGRLDFNTSGALLISNDGELTNLVTHPSTHLDKTYIATIDSFVKDEHLIQLQRGVKLEDGMTEPSKIKIIKRDESKSIISITIHERRNRQVRRMFEKIGFLTLEGIERGAYRRLTLEEVNKIKKICKENKSKNIVPEYKRK